MKFEGGVLPVLRGRCARGECACWAARDRRPLQSDVLSLRIPDSHASLHPGSTTHNADTCDHRQNCPFLFLNFSMPENFFFWSKNFPPKIQHIGLKIPHFKKFRVKVKILTNHSLSENCHFLPQHFRTTMPRSNVMPDTDSGATNAEMGEICPHLPLNRWLASPNFFTAGGLELKLVMPKPACKIYSAPQTYQLHVGREKRLEKKEKRERGRKKGEEGF